MKLYPTDTLARFEFPAVVNQIHDIAQSRRGKEFALTLQPIDEVARIEELLNQTFELKTILENGIFFPEFSFPNIGRELDKLTIENSVLEGEEIIKLRKIAEVAATIIKFFKEKKSLYPALKEITAGLEASKEFIAMIDEILEPNGFIKSRASKELAAARKQLAEARQKANKVFESQLRKFKNLGWLREYSESFYNERRVLAVLAEYKRQIPGTLHGSSESGSTAFIEPSSVVALNNDVAEARQREQREEYRILRQLTARIRNHRHVLESYERALGFLDFTFAKAKYAVQIHANRPIISKEKNIELHKAYHPVLLTQNLREGKKTVPLNLYLNRQKRILVISGPNAGGKSISLKTLGLLQIMFQSGVLIPAADTSSMGVFKQIFVDIGDDQSIAYELSTYSSRLLKMKHFLFHAHKNTLFFIDEFGTGSDPELGGAMAEVILEELAETKAFGIITTHYANIKIMAETNQHMMNGSMLFNEKTLQPKYELHIGNAGSSYTFEVAQKIGLDKEIIDRAKKKLDSQKIKFDTLLTTLQAKRNELNKETHRLRKEKEIMQKEVEASRREAELYRQKQEDLNFSENKQLIERGKKYDALLEAWQEKSKRRDLAHRLTLQAEREAARKKEADMVEKLREKQERIRRQKQNRRKKKKIEKKLSKKPIEVGHQVKLRTSPQVGVVEEISKNKATVVFGMVKTIVPLEKLIHIA